jgi:hypothetical protein
VAHGRTFLIWLALVATLGGCGGDGGAASIAPTEPEQSGSGSLRPLETGRDVLAPDGRYSLRVPGEWVQYDDPIAELAFRTTTENPALTMNVVREDIEGNLRPQAYAEGARRRVGSVYRNVISLSLSPVRIGEMEAFRWIYTATAGQRERVFYQVFVIDGNQGFVLTGMAPIGADLATTQATFDSIAGSLTFARG